MKYARKSGKVSGLTHMCVLVSLAGLLLIGTPKALSSGDDFGPPSFSEMADEVKHCVVNISTTQVVQAEPSEPFAAPDSPFRDFFGDDFFKRFFGDVPRGPMKTHALGSGFVISNDGFILTNNHVVEKATEIQVILEKGAEYEAKVVGTDPLTDLALIKTKPGSDFPEPARLGDSEEIRVGDWVMAVGNPFGLGHSVTVGIISAKGRVIGAGPYDNFLQTDAAINPGNSGGPLFNMNGEVVGINTAIIAHGQNIGFATPINTAKALIPQLKSGRIVRGWLGVMIQDVTPELAKAFHFKEHKGGLVAEVVQGSPADRAGLRQGDLIVRVNGQDVENAHALSALIAGTKPNTEVTLDIVRDGKEKSIKVTLGVMPSMAETSPAEEKTDLGLTVRNLSPDLREQLGLGRGVRGVVVSRVEPGSAAADAGLQPGDVITEVNRTTVKDVSDYTTALEKGRKGESILFLVKRGEGSLYIVVKLRDRE